ncbi:MAG: hypothetical protein IJF48_02240 [Clostridia bacterium]|nr:hypothetical protein [Clostridia bacterium]
MSIFSKKNKAPKQKFAYRKIVAASKLASPILAGLYYAFIIGVLLLGIIALILLFVNTSVEEMMLPPFMTVHENEYYSITIGNGIRINAAYAEVSLGDIKTVIYAELMMLAAVLCILSPIALFLSKLAKNISKGEEYNLKNPRYIIYIGLTVMVGSTFVRIANSFYNYLLVKTFVSQPEMIRFSFGLDLGGIMTGLLIIVIAYIYGHVCEKYFVEHSAPETSTDIEAV